MGLYVKVVLMYGRRELGEKEVTPIAFELESGGMFSQDEFEETARNLNLQIPLIYENREVAEQDASRLGVRLAVRSYAQAQAREREEAERHEWRRRKEAIDYGKVI